MRSEGGLPRAPREVFHTLRGRRKVIHAIQGGSSMRSKGGDPHVAREVIRTLQGGDPHAPREVFHALPWDVIHAL